jgi:hypothetical protein
MRRDASRWAFFLAVFEDHAPSKLAEKRLYGGQTISGPRTSRRYRELPSSTGACRRLASFGCVCWVTCSDLSVSHTERMKSEGSTVSADVNVRANVSVRPPMDREREPLRTGQHFVYLDETTFISRHDSVVGVAALVTTTHVDEALVQRAMSRLWLDPDRLPSSPRYSTRCELY